MIAPTSQERIAVIAREAEGFLYIVSSLGVTGTRKEIKTDLDSILNAVSDGVIVGSAIIKLLAQYGKEAPSYIGAYVKSMKDAINCN